MAFSKSEVTSRIHIESSSESSPGRRMGVFSPTTDHFLLSSAMASLLGPLHSSPTMAGTQTVARTSTTVPETAQLQQQDVAMVEAEAENAQQQDNDVVQEAEEENVQQEDIDTDNPEAEPENHDEQLEGLYADNFGGEAVEELTPPVPAPAAPVQALRREILVRSQLVFLDFKQHVVDRTHVGAIFADECDSWLELAQRVRLIYDRVADPDAAAEDLTMWPGRVVRFYSRDVDGQVIERYCPQDDWVDLDLANNLFLVKLELLPQGRMCRIVEAFSDGTEEQYTQIVIHKFPTWQDFLARIREVYYTFFPGNPAPALDAVTSPFNCCPGAHVTFWGDLKEQWFWSTNHRGNGWQFNWPAACQGICKVRINRYKY